MLTHDDLKYVGEGWMGGDGGAQNLLISKHQQTNNSDPTNTTVS